MTAARPGQFTGATDDASEGGLFTDTLVDGIPDIVGADVLAAQTAATAAAASETNAATSETNAATSATTASDKASEAETSAEAAAGSAEAAAASAQEASDDVDSIGSSVEDAADSAEAALESESQAAASATAAGNAKTDAISARDTAVSSSESANNSAIAAAGSAAAAEATFDLFDDSYLGSKAADPTVDNDGDPLTDGDLYFNTTDNVMKVYDLGTTTWLLLTPTVANQNNINTVAGIQADVTTVAGIDSDVTTVAADASDISTVSTNIANVNTVAGNDTNISTLAGIDSNITTVAGISANVTTVATNDANVTTVAGISGNVTTVAGISSDVTNVANDATDIGTVSTNIANVNTVATNITDVNSFADTYFISATAPASPGEGDLWYDSTANKLKIYNGTSWVDSATAVSVIMDKQNYTATSNQTVFNVTYDLGFVDVFLNGVKLQETTDYTATNGTSITLTTGATVGDAVDLVGYGAFQIADTVPASTGGTFSGPITATSFTGDGSALTAINIVNDTSPQLGGDLSTNGNDINFEDNDKAQFGTGNDLQVYHDGSNSYIDDSGTGSLNIRSSQIEFQKYTGETLAEFTADGAASLYYDNSKKLETYAFGINVTGSAILSGALIMNSGNIQLEDGYQILLGSSSDLRIYHNGINSYIRDNGSGDLILQASENLLLESTSGEDYINCNNNGSVEVFYNGGRKFETTATGITVTGTAIASSQTASISGSTTLDFGTYQNFILTLTGSITLANPTTEQVGQSGFITFIQTGGYTVSLGTDYETAGGAGITLSASGTDVVPYIVAASGRILLGTPQLAFA